MSEDRKSKHKSKIIHDDLRPISEHGQEYVKLWQSVLIRALRDAVENRKEAIKLKAWANTQACRIVCALANISYDIVREKFNTISIWDENSAEMLLNLSYFRSAHNQYQKRNPKTGLNYNETI